MAYLKNGDVLRMLETNVTWGTSLPGQFGQFLDLLWVRWPSLDAATQPRPFLGR
jgi:hypothetical protein